MHELEIRRGAVFRAHQWVLVDDDGAPLRPDGRSLTVVSKVRRAANSTQVLHTFGTAIVQLVLPDEYDDQPVLAAQLNPMTAEQTAALGFDRGVYDILVDDQLIFPTTTVTAPWVASR
ncbi:hypothetical protein GCM10009613_61380 [Pseudonocardia kongjuensis]|uniref:Uncharacterized protein n=1 Tax=Pseudonocardia kongjuensis TaxID=102227 RepID=A0ABN1YF23_9PSEU